VIFTPALVHPESQIRDPTAASSAGQVGLE